MPICTELHGVPLNRGSLVKIDQFTAAGSARNSLHRTSPYVEPWPIGGLSLSDLSTFTSVLLAFFIAFFSFFIFLSIFDLSFFLPIALLRLKRVSHVSRSNAYAAPLSARNSSSSST